MLLGSVLHELFSTCGCVETWVSCNKKYINKDEHRASYDIESIEIVSENIASNQNYKGHN